MSSSPGTGARIHVVVVGGETNGYRRIMGAFYAQNVSVDDWRQRD